MSRPRSKYRVLSSAFLAAALVAALLVFPAPPAVAVANIQVEKTMPSQTLIGGETEVTLRFTNTGDTTAYNLTITDVLPEGVTISSSTIPLDADLEDVPAAGETTIGWQNIVDIRPGGVLEVSYSISHDLALYSIGDTVGNTISAYVSDDPGTVPTIQPDGSVTGADDSATDTASTILVPVLIEKSEPSPEAELLRGLHDHQTVYTISLRAGAEAGATIDALDDYLPAGLEFLGCGDVDNSLTEEYPGAGAINPGNAPALTEPCGDPALVETVTIDPDGGGPLPSGVYTHVQWDAAALAALGIDALAAGETLKMQYVAAIPMFENTTAWGVLGVPDPAGLGQTANLRNNNGSSTEETLAEITYSNLARAEVTYLGDGSDLTIEDTESVTSEDVAIHKFVNEPTIEQGSVSIWVLQILTSEYVSEVTDIEVTDTTPDGTCPILPGNPAGCTATAPTPIPPVASAVDNGDGTWTLGWDGLLDMGRSDQQLIGFATEARETYEDGGPVSANDSWTNLTSLTADADGRDVQDTSQASQSGTASTLAKDVGIPAPGETCDDGQNVAWNPESVDDIGPGDRVCYRLTVTLPDTLDTLSARLVDFLPPGFELEAYEVGPANMVPPEQIDGPCGAPSATCADPRPTGRIDFTFADPGNLEPAEDVQIVYGVVVAGAGIPDNASSGGSVPNEARFAFENTSGEIFVEEDSASVVWSEPEISLAKIVRDVNDVVVNAEAAPVDPGDVVTYWVTVSNGGDRDALEVEVWDLLPNSATSATTCAEITNVGNGGACNATEDRIEWTIATIGAGDSVTLSYDYTVPDPVGASAQFDNPAGVRTYQSGTNIPGDFFDYYPRDNIDPTLGPLENTTHADDEATIYTAGVLVEKTRQTEITEDGNALGNQATIGEVISYRVEMSLDGDLTLVDPLFVDTLGAGQDILGATVTFGLDDDNDGTFDPLPAGWVTTVTAGQITIDPDTDLVSGPTGAVVRVAFDAIVTDVPAAARPGRVSNTAVVTYEVDGEAVESRDTINTQIVEPDVDIEKSSDASDGVFTPGQAVTYTLVVTNTSGEQVSTAHDLSIVDTYDADVTGVTAIEVCDAMGSCVAAGSDDGSAVIWTTGDIGTDPDGDGEPGLSPGASFSVRYTATSAAPLLPGEELDNTAEVTNYSRPLLIPNERREYAAEDDLTLTTAQASIFKGVFPDDATIGTDVRYAFTVLLPPSLTFNDLTIVDDLPAGITYLSGGQIVCLPNCDPDASAAAPTATPAADNGQIEWDLGDVGAGDGLRILVGTYVAEVNDTTGAGDTETNTLTLTYEGGSDSDTATVDVHEPDVSILKEVGTPIDSVQETPTEADAVTGLLDNWIEYRVTVTNPSDWIAYDLSVVDTVDTGLVQDPMVPITSGPGYDLVDGDPSDGILEWSVPTLLPGQSIEIIYRLFIPIDYPGPFTPDPEIENTVCVDEFFGLYVDDRDEDFNTYPPVPVCDQAWVDIPFTAGFGDFAWFDVDADGVQDPGEPGVGGANIFVTGFGSQTTDADGLYAFQGLPEDDYQAVLTPPAGLNLVPGSDLDGGDPAVTDFFLADGEVRLDIDFGLVGDAAIDGVVFLDLDADGVRGPAELGVPGVDVQLTYNGPLPLVETLTTDLLGEFQRTQIPAGEYETTMDLATIPDGYVATTPTIFTVDVPLGGMEHVEFGIVPVSSVGTWVWIDADGDGVKGADEEGIPGISVEVVQGGSVVASTVTGPDGSYLVDGLFPGQTTVRIDESQVAGFLATYDRDGTLDYETTFLILPGQDVLDADFGFLELFDVGSWVWVDSNGDGNRDDNEPGIPNVIVQLIQDGTLVASTVTDGSGYYEFTDQLAGETTVRLDPASIDDKYTPTFDRDGALDLETSFVLSVDVLDADFGFLDTSVLPITGIFIGILVLLGLGLWMTGSGITIASRKVEGREG